MLSSSTHSLRSPGSSSSTSSFSSFPDEGFWLAGSDSSSILATAFLAFPDSFLLSGSSCNSTPSCGSPGSSSVSSSVSFTSSFPFKEFFLAPIHPILAPAFSTCSDPYPLSGSSSKATPSCGLPGSSSVTSSFSVTSSSPF